MNYYNEFDPYAAQWLRNLIQAGHILQGDVDSRSIKDVKASDLTGYTQCHFFAGLGGWSYALRLAGWPKDRPVWTGSCPCQPFSAAGAGGGVTDERHLWPTWFNLIRECRPDVIFGEQVEAAVNHGWLDLVQADLAGEGYASGAVGIPAGGVGAPHIRQRLWFVADAASKRGNERFELESYGRTGETKQDGLGSEFNQLANGQRKGLEGHLGDGNDRNEPGRVNAQQAGSVAPSSWSDCDWLPCRDGKARPVEPGTFPLAHGISGRVGRLRAYGNAIVPQVAQVFIEAYLES
jgi:DNA (cytosine-5)-methyltransferase 1